MRLRAVRTVLLTGPCTDDPWLSVFKQSRTAALVEVEAENGLVGLGETYAGYFFPESVPLIVDYLKPILLAVDDFEPTAEAVHILTARMRTCFAFWGRVGLGAAVLAGIEGALWDLAGKLVGWPVHRLLSEASPTQPARRAARPANETTGTGAASGNPTVDTGRGSSPSPPADTGREPSPAPPADTGRGSSPWPPADLPAYATGGPSPWPQADLLRKVDFYRSLGFTAVKLASGYLEAASRTEVAPPGGPAEGEAEKVTRLRAEFGAELGILLDGHMGHREGADRWTADTARQVLDALAPHGLIFFEEPLPYDDLAGYAELTGHSSVPVAGGEQLTSHAEFATFADRRAFAVAQPDAAWLGIEGFVRVARRFAEDGRTVAPHAWSAGVGVMQNVHAAFACANTLIVELPPAAGPLHTELWGGSLRVREGKVVRPDEPGLGVRLTDDARKRFPFRPGAEEFSSVPGKLMRS